MAPLDNGWSPDVQATFCSTLVDEWIRCGVTDAVVCPGSRSTPLALAVARSSLTLHVHHDERSGAFLALGLAATTGRPVPVVVTSGTAAVNLHPAVVEADLLGVPLLICTADRPVELRDVGAPQTIDQDRLYGRSTRWYLAPGTPDGALAGTWRSWAARAVHLARGPRPGPVHLELAFREPLLGTPAPLPAPRDAGPWQLDVRGETTGPELDPDIAAARGIIVAGRHPFAPDAVLALGDALGWPVFADPLSGCRGGSAIAGFDPLLRTSMAERARPEVVLRVGSPPASKVFGQWLAEVDAAEIVVAPDTWPDPGHRMAVRLDALPLVPSGHEPVAEWRAAWHEADALAQAAIDDAMAAAPLSEPAVARHLTRSLPAGSLLVASSSMPIRDVEWYGISRGDLRVHANRGANGIDGVTSTAAGAALAGVRTTLLIGDVAFLHDTNGLLGLADRDVDCTIVVLDNRGGGIFSFLPQATELDHDTHERLFGTPHSVDLTALAGAHGIPVIEANRVEDLQWQPGVRVVVVRTDRAENVVEHRRLEAAVRDAISGPGDR